MRPEVLVTGVGMVSAAGTTADETWASLLSGHAPPACEDGFLRHATTNGSRHPRETAEAAMLEAIRQAGGATALCGKNVSLCLGASKSFMGTITPSQTFLHLPYVDFYTCMETLSGSPQYLARAACGILGAPVAVHNSVAACATGTFAAIRGIQMILDGEADVAICGAADASIHPLWLGAFCQMGVLANGSPAGVCRPFDRDRCGFVVAEGAGFLVLESAQSAGSRREQALVSIEGYATGTDPTGMTQMDPAGDVLAQVIRMACARAGRRPEEIGCVHAHGTGTPANDPIETRAIRAALGPGAASVPIASMKGALGHMLGAAGAVELAVASLARREGRSPGTCTLRTPDPQLGPLNLPQAPFELGKGPILKTSLGFGGHIAAVLIGGI